MGKNLQNQVLMKLGTSIKGKTPDDWIRYREYLVEEENRKKGSQFNPYSSRVYFDGVLVGKDYSPKQAYETIEAWERTGESKLLQAGTKLT